MNEPIQRTLTVPLSGADAFDLFAMELAQWWPREYTWGRDAMESIGIEPRVGGLCYELGPGGFRCDWGHVLVWDPPRRLELAWQISPRREPEPNPSRASTVEVRFDEQDPGHTMVTLTHGDFDRHGADAAAYRDAMASPQGWPHIMEQYAGAAG